MAATHVFLSYCRDNAKQVAPTEPECGPFRDGPPEFNRRVAGLFLAGRDPRGSAARPTIEEPGSLW